MATWNPTENADRTTLKLEDLSPDDIGSDEALFGDAGLGLDSIDALEIGVSIRKIYGSRSTASDEVKKCFACIRNLAEFVRLHREGVR
jgi:acyl carrier protein